MKPSVSVVVPNWNGVGLLPGCLTSLVNQTFPANLVVVDNGSTDGSQDFIKANFPTVKLIELPDNRGFASGANSGIQVSMMQGDQYVALFNNDAEADPSWLSHLVESAESKPNLAAVTGKLLRWDGLTIDTAGDFYSTWGWPCPRGRDELDIGQYDHAEDVFAATGGASLYRLSALREIGLFDEDFFAYYEDVDLSFRARLAGWNIHYDPRAIARHRVGATSSGVPDLIRYNSIKNFAFLYLNNMPAPLFWKYLPRFCLSFTLLIANSIVKGQGLPTLKSLGTLARSSGRIIQKRRQIQSLRKAQSSDIDALLFRGWPGTLGQPCKRVTHHQLNE